MLVRISEDIVRSKNNDTYTNVFPLCNSMYCRLSLKGRESRTAGSRVRAPTVAERGPSRLALGRKPFIF